MSRTKSEITPSHPCAKSRGVLPGIAVLAVFLLLPRAPCCLGAEATAPATTPTAEVTNPQVKSGPREAVLNRTETGVTAGSPEVRSSEPTDGEAGLGRRWEALAQALATEHAREAESARHAQQLLLWAAGALAAVGLLPLVCLAYFQWQMLRRLADAPRSSCEPRAPLLEPVAAAGNGHPDLVKVDAVEQSNLQLLSALDRLERRIGALDRPGLAPNNGAPPVPASKPSDLEPQASPAAAPGRGEAGAPDARLSVLLGRGESLLQLGRLEEARGCFEQALALEPGHAGALMKQALVCERLGRFEEALRCYDRAIAAEPSLTLAYIYKGGLLNRRERFAEALTCYEQAMRMQGQSH